MTNPVVIGGATLWLGDCREILPELPKVDMVFTSPPYNLGNTTGGEDRWLRCDKTPKFDEQHPTVYARILDETRAKLAAQQCDLLGAKL